MAKQTDQTDQTDQVSQVTQAEVELAKAQVKIQLIRSSERGIVFLVVAGFIIWQLDEETAKSFIPILTYFLGVVTNHYFRSDNS